MKFGPGGFTRLSWVFQAENTDGLMPAHTEGHDRNLFVGTQVLSLRILGPLDGAPGARQLLAILCVFVPCSSCFGQL
jgi:hypothetical protein